MKLTEFDYQLPKALIAQYPLKARDSARLLVINRQSATIEHRTFADFTEYLHKDDCVVLNDTKVLPSRLIGRRKTGGRVEILLLGQVHEGIFNALVKPARVRQDEEIIFNNGTISGRLVSRNQIIFSIKDKEALYAHGQMPLPPYIKRPPEDVDEEYYQTVYAQHAGAVASPTAGLHFTSELLAKIRAQKVHIACLTLHVGYATFKPVKDDDIRRHTMEPEYFRIPDTTARVIAETRLNKGRIVAVGTTSCRALETYALGQKEGQTNLFIYPGFAFRLVDCLLTNFHLPRTTLFMLVCAFGTSELVKRAYREAIEKKYRFYSYGDAMLIT